MNETTVITPTGHPGRAGEQPPVERPDTVAPW
jgi:hypothetical protein